MFRVLLYRDMDVALLDVLTIVEHGIALGYDVDVLQADTIDGHLGQTVVQASCYVGFSS